jgi:hypothetical protein
MGNVLAGLLIRQPVFVPMQPVTAAGRDDMASGPGYFHPQWTDKQGLAAAYP